MRSLATDLRANEPEVTKQPEVAANTLDAATLVSYLISRDLIDTESIVNGTIVVRSQPRRNYNFEVKRNVGLSYFVKQGVDADTNATIEREAAAYEFLSNPKIRISRYVPKFIGFDRARSILILELVDNSINFSDYVAKRGRFSYSLGRELGRALASLHSLGQAAPFAQDGDVVPWGLTFPNTSLDSLRELSAASIELLRVGQSYHGYRALLSELKKDWSPGSLIHTDIKGSNCLARTGSGDRLTRVSIVDWELATLGDPLWDVGSAFADYLASWVYSIPIMSDTPVERFPQLARYRLTDIQPAIKRFWDAYSTGRGFNDTAAADAILGSVKYAAARLAQTAFEETQSKIALSGTALCLLQLSWNILKRPTEAVARLLGIEVLGRWPAI